MGLRFCVSNKLPDDSNTTGLLTTLSKAQHLGSPNFLQSNVPKFILVIQTPLQNSNFQLQLLVGSSLWIFKGISPRVLKPAPPQFLPQCSLA